ncbi:MAG: ring-cleaving dioxygenase [Planctomycetota bacterium]
MDSLITGIHHVTAVAKDPLKNFEFYTSLLGLRMVKKTVNFDDPLTYHLYYGDHRGSPGTLLTHFPHPLSRAGVHGSPEILETRLRVADGTLDSWAERLGSHGVKAELVDDDGVRRLAFGDHDDMRFALVEEPAEATDERSILGIESVSIRVPDVGATSSFLEEVLGFATAARSESGARLTLGDGAPGRRLELVQAAIDPQTSMGAGTVHHVAWRVPDDETQARVAAALTEAGIAVTPVMDRQYFRSIYFRIPGGVIFEVATDGPGFDVDEPLETLGEALKLPPQYEARRSEIAAHLVPLDGAHA